MRHARALRLGILWLAAARAPGQDEFRWSWEPGEPGEPAAPAAAQPQPPAPAGGDDAGGFSWSWEARPGGPGDDAAPVEPALEQRLRQAETDKRRLEAQLEELRGRLDAEPQPVAREQTEALELQLQAARSEQTALREQLETLRLELAARPAAAAAAPAEPATAVRPGSDLFREMEKENVELRDRIAATEEDRRRIEQSLSRTETQAEEQRGAIEAHRRRQEELKEQLDHARISERKYEKMVGELIRRVPEMEQNLLGLRAAVEEKDRALAAAERELEALRSELRRREYRLRKAERAAEMIETARQEVRQIGAREKRDLHFNMGVVYAGQGRHRDAEQEYLRALRLDPGDPDVHYNLAILYDDELDDKLKAVMHYRKYLQLRPRASDAETVRQWLMQIEMGTR